MKKIAGAFRKCVDTIRRLIREQWRKSKEKIEVFRAVEINRWIVGGCGALAMTIVAAIIAFNAENMIIKLMFTLGFVAWIADTYMIFDEVIRLRYGDSEDNDEM